MQWCDMQTVTRGLFILNLKAFDNKEGHVMSAWQPSVFCHKQVFLAHLYGTVYRLIVKVIIS